MITGSVPNWRNEQGLVSNNSYKKRFAFLPVTCSCGTKIWLKSYYSKFIMTTSGWAPLRPHDDLEDVHVDFVEKITEAEYIVRKLSENL